ncbi:hypothetical protein CAPTEDRAFT_195485 [Capitella teleta]|uniref:DUF7869 domain-containing protein n=1 Tax=Capitella teleta TaxID=283909 RepID=R7V3Q5_CAPTE|nr:hypothetical protein CAPTEDRAFT_195485 [Capitella teleta]|eukprot:ELU10976.1 hypothetical protein CAPTEDRAFT_195485 [Capitella teleta]
MTDLCATCQQNNYLIYKSVNLAEEDKCEKLQKQESHLMQVHEERSLYQQMCDQAKAVCKEEGIDALQESAACNRGMTMHYSFDYAQQVHLPKQNKNKFVLWYLAWRVAVGLHKSITLNFLVVGHAKFAPGWCFGLVKQAFRRHVVNYVSCLAAVVNGSASCNEAAVVGTEDGNNNILVMDWQGHFHDIKQYQHFRFDWQHPGVVFFKTRISDEEGSFKLFKDSPLPTTAATPITPPGLSRERQAYLYEKIRPFVEDEFKDVVCPPPASRTTPREPSPQPPSPPAAAPAAKRQKRRSVKKK